MRVNRRRMFVAGGLVIFLVLTVSGSAWAKPLPNRQWRKVANSACEQFHEDRLGLLPESGLAVTTREQALPYVEAAVPLYEGLIDSIGSLEEPKARKKEVQKFLSALTSAVATLEENPLAAFSAFDDPFAKAHRGASKLHLKSCIGLGDQRV
jgi:hypothetical protein